MESEIMALVLYFHLYVQCYHEKENKIDTVILTQCENKNNCFNNEIRIILAHYFNKLHLHNLKEIIFVH